MNTPEHFRSAACYFRPVDDLREVGRADLLFALRHQHQITGGFLPAPRMAWSAARKAASGPFWFTAPRPTITFPRPGLSTSAASHGGEDHSAGSTCFTSYMK